MCFGGNGCGYGSVEVVDVDPSFASRACPEFDVGSYSRWCMKRWGPASNHPGALRGLCVVQRRLLPVQNQEVFSSFQPTSLQEDIGGLVSFQYI